MKKYKTKAIFLPVQRGSQPLDSQGVEARLRSLREMVTKDEEKLLEGKNPFVTPVSEHEHEHGHGAHSHGHHHHHKK